MGHEQCFAFGRLVAGIPAILYAPSITLFVVVVTLYEQWLELLLTTLDRQIT
jgi:hypothetical protein